MFTCHFWLLRKIPNIFIKSLECGCNSTNSITQHCDSSGKCSCEENFSGFKCTDCAPGFFGYPKCKGT